MRKSEVGGVRVGGREGERVREIGGVRKIRKGGRKEGIRER